MDFNPSHPIYEDGGKRIHSFSFDLETQGLRTTSFTPGSTAKRTFAEPLGISEISFGYVGRNAEINAHTDLVTKELLDRHGVTMEMLQDPKADLPQSLWDEVVRSPKNKYDPSKPPLWDPSVMENRGPTGQPSVLNTVFRNNARAALAGETVSTEKVFGNLLDMWEGIAAKNEIVELTAWNVSYDSQTLIDGILKSPHRDRMDKLLQSKSIRVREMADSVHKGRFEYMLKNRNWIPGMIDKSVFERARAGGVGAVFTAEEAAKHKAFTKHTGLRAFMDDMIDERAGKSAFKDRLFKWAEAQGAGKAQAQAAAGDVLNLIGNASKDWDSFKAFIARGQKNASQLIYGEKTVYDVVGEVWGTQGAKHVNLFGDRGMMALASQIGMEGNYSAFSMIGGYRLEETASNLIENAEQLGVSSGTVSRMKELMGAGVHSAKVDRPLADLTMAEMDRITRNKALFDRWQATDAVKHEAALQKGLQRQWQDHRRANVTQTGGGKNTIKTGPGKVFNKLPWLGIATIALGSYVIGQHNKVEQPPTIEGFRHPEGEYDQISGIDASELPYANISAFGSGYDHGIGNQYAPQKVRISRVLDGDTVVFYQGGQEVHARLAGINTAEVAHGRRRAQATANAAAQFLDEMVRGQEVWIRSQVGDAVDTYGRRLVHMDYQGVNVNSEIVRKGFSRANRPMTEPYVEGPEIFGYLRHRMGIQIDNTIDYVKSLFTSDIPPPDPFMWTALGTVGTLTSEDESGVPNQEEVGYSGEAAKAWRETSHGGYVQHLSQDMMGSKIRDHATQLHRFPGMPRTPKGRRALAYTSHAERM